MTEQTAMPKSRHRISKDIIGVLVDLEKEARHLAEGIGPQQQDNPGEIGGEVVLNKQTKPAEKTAAQQGRDYYGVEHGKVHDVNLRLRLFLGKVNAGAVHHVEGKEWYHQPGSDHN